MNGTVKWFNNTKNFGFVTGEDDNDYFVHGSQVPDDMRITEGTTVTFDLKKTEKGKQAINLAYQ